MVDDVVNVKFKRDPIYDSNGDKGFLSGNFRVNYTNFRATGSLVFREPDGTIEKFDPLSSLLPGGGGIRNSYSIQGYTLGFDGIRLDPFSVFWSTNTNSGVALTQTPTHANMSLLLTGDFDTNFGSKHAEPVTSTQVSGAPCFVSGTLITTTRGDIPVESLKIGDVVVTASGGHRPVRWVGHRPINCRRHPSPDQVYPVRIRAGAFGTDRPNRDLYVSPNHAICVRCLDVVLVHAASLINGATIERAPIDTVTYWHVELDRHDILFANGLPAESYLEMCNRSFFVENDNVALHAVPDATHNTIADFCRPLILSGPVIAAIRERLEARVRAMGLQVPEIEFNETNYLEANIDVAAAVKIGSFESGRQHWTLFGRDEGRSPNPAIKYIAA